jgi:hypothetical protein
MKSKTLRSLWLLDQVNHESLDDSQFEIFKLENRDEVESTFF